MDAKELAHELLKVNAKIHTVDSVEELTRLIQEATDLIRQVRDLPEGEREVTRQELMDIADEEGLLEHMKN